MLCPFQKITIKLDAFDNKVIKDVQTATIKEIFAECSTDCASRHLYALLCFKK